MNKAAKVLLAVGVIIVLSYPGIAWVTGVVVESRLQHNEQLVLDKSPYITVVKREYHRGVYRSTSLTTFGLHIPLPKPPQSAGAPAALLSAFTITVASTIRHGPFPGLRGVGLAVIDSTIVVPPALQKELSGLIGSKPILQLHSTVGLLGNTTVDVASPAFSTRLPNASNVAWGGLTGTIVISRNQAGWSGKVSAPQLLIQGPRSFELTGVEYSGAHQKAFGELYLGSSTCTIERLDGSGPRPGSDFSLQRIAISTRSKADGDFFDMRVDMAMDAAKVSAVPLTNVVYSVGFEHVHGPSFVSMVDAMRAAQLQSGGNQAQLQAGFQSAFREYGPALLAHDPVLNFRQISFTMPEGSFFLSAKISAPGLAPADLQMPAAIMALRTHGHVTADLRVDNGLVQKLLTLSASNPKVAAQLTSFEQQGYLTAGAAAVTTHLEFSGGRITLNGHPFPPAAPVN